jgi:hypothetical protein
MMLFVVLVVVLVVAALALVFSGGFPSVGDRTRRRTVVIERPVTRRRVRRVVEEPVHEVDEVVEDRY